MGYEKDNRNYERNNSNRTSKGGEYLVRGENFDSQNAQNSHEPVQAKPLEVVVINGGFDRAFKIFRSLCQKERILSSFKDKQSYEKPSDKKRRKKNESARKRLELDSKAESFNNKKDY